MHDHIENIIATLESLSSIYEHIERFCDERETVSALNGANVILNLAIETLQQQAEIEKIEEK